MTVPTVLRVGAYGFFFYSVDDSEPAHIHVARDDNVAKFWLDPVRLVRSGQFSRTELREVGRPVGENVEVLLEGWRG